MKTQILLTVLTFTLLPGASGCAAAAPSGSDIVVRHAENTVMTYDETVRDFANLRGLAGDNSDEYCRKSLANAQALGATFPSGEDRFLQACREGLKS
ncbi:hypothetical protein [Actinomadura pelletieri]|nr:hypothetical protein [Actinomadura pelletieri]